MPRHIMQPHKRLCSGSAVLGPELDKLVPYA